MAQFDDTPLTLMSVTEQVLTRSFNGAVRLGNGESLDASPRSTVDRYVVREGPHGVPASVIVKRAGGEGETYDPDAADGSAPRLFNEWAGLQFLDHLGGAHSPAARFYGGDRATGLVVLEDLGTAAHLDGILLGNNPTAAEDALIDLATTLGRMHTLTIGNDRVYRQIRAALGPLERDIASYDWLAPRFRTMADALGIAPQPGTEADLATLRAVLRHPGPFLAYTHGDACPDNCLRVGGTVRLFDFEGGYLRHALIEGVFGRLHFPSCWCVGRLPAPIPQRLARRGAPPRPTIPSSSVPLSRRVSIG